jgi:hypothetical protein
MWYGICQIFSDPIVHPFTKNQKMGAMCVSMTMACASAFFVLSGDFAPATAAAYASLLVLTYLVPRVTADRIGKMLLGMTEEVVD